MVASIGLKIGQSESRAALYVVLYASLYVVLYVVPAWRGIAFRRATQVLFRTADCVARNCIPPSYPSAFSNRRLLRGGMPFRTTISQNMMRGGIDARELKENAKFPSTWRGML